jgi:hypothetical protein
MTKLKSIKLNNYVKPNPHTLVTQSNQMITNGVDNDFFYYVEDRYLGSPTNQSVIDNVVNYIYGNGMEVTKGNIKLEEIISKGDLKSFITDFKMQGAGVLQVIYAYGIEKKIAKMVYFPTKTIAIKKQKDLSDEIEAYWYCFDWKNKSRFQPQLIPAFGYGENNETEILYIKRPTPQPLFPLPDYLSGLQYCKVEEELSNYYINHIQNNFSAGKIVNIYQGKEWTEDAMDVASDSINNKLAGTSNAGTSIIAFNDSTEGKTTVESIEITDAYQQFETLSKQCIEKILLSHKIVDPILVGLPQPTGFSSQAEQMEMSLKLLYRSQIYPTRELILKGLEDALRINDPSIELGFLDFEELDTEDSYNITNIISIIEKYNNSGIVYELALIILAQLMAITTDEAKVYLPKKENNDNITQITE